MLQNAYFLAKIGADTAENEQHFAEILPTDANRSSSVDPATNQRLSRRCPPLSPLPLPGGDREEGGARSADRDLGGTPIIPINPFGGVDDNT